MSEMVSSRASAFVVPAGRVAGRARPIPTGYGLLIALILSAGLWVGLGLAIVRLWF
ncbi:MAG TPA: hypothetical protein VF474_15020 [Phenylobacterium sp.]